MARVFQLIASLLLLALAATGCSTTHPWRAVPQPWTAASLEGVERVRVERDDGWTVELELPRWAEGPEGPALAGRVVGEQREVAVPFASIRVLEAQRFEGEAAVANVATVVVVLVLVLFVVAMIATLSVSVGASMAGI